MITSGVTKYVVLSLVSVTPGLCLLPDGYLYEEYKFGVNPNAWVISCKATFTYISNYASSEISIFSK